MSRAGCACPAVVSLAVALSVAALEAEVVPTWGNTEGGTALARAEVECLMSDLGDAVTARYLYGLPVDENKFGFQTMRLGGPSDQ